MLIAIETDGRTYFLSEDLPYPHWSDCSIEGEDYLSAMKAIELYPNESTWLICASNMAIKEANNGNGSTVGSPPIALGGGDVRGTSEGDHQDN